MAKVYSTDRFRSAGGDWGRWFERKEMNPALADIAFSLKPGQRGPVVEVPDERTKATVCYLLMVDDVRPAHITPLSEVQVAIDKVLKAQRGSMLLEQWIKRLQAKSHVENF
jgi:parvulin-like peptidyl-prolyl isomerase